MDKKILRQMSRITEKKLMKTRFLPFFLMTILLAFFGQTVSAFNMEDVPAADFVEGDPPTYVCCQEEWCQYIYQEYVEGTSATDKFSLEGSCGGLKTSSEQLLAFGGTLGAQVDAAFCLCVRNRAERFPGLSEEAQTKKELFQSMKRRYAGELFINGIDEVIKSLAEIAAVKTITPKGDISQINMPNCRLNHMRDQLNNMRKTGCGKGMSAEDFDKNMGRVFGFTSVDLLMNDINNRFKMAIDNRLPTDRELDRHTDPNKRAMSCLPMQWHFKMKQHQALEEMAKITKEVFAIQNGFKKQIKNNLHHILIRNLDQVPLEYRDPEVLKGMSQEEMKEKLGLKNFTSYEIMATKAATRDHPALKEIMSDRTMRGMVNRAIEMRNIDLIRGVVLGNFFKSKTGRLRQIFGPKYEHLFTSEASIVDYMRFMDKFNEKDEITPQAMLGYYNGHDADKRYEAATNQRCEELFQGNLMNKLLCEDDINLGSKFMNNSVVNAVPALKGNIDYFEVLQCQEQGDVDPLLGKLFKNRPNQNEFDVAALTEKSTLGPKYKDIIETNNNLCSMVRDCSDPDNCQFRDVTKMIESLRSPSFASVTRGVIFGGSSRAPQTDSLNPIYRFRAEKLEEWQRSMEFIRSLNPDSGGKSDNELMKSMKIKNAASKITDMVKTAAIKGIGTNEGDGGGNDSGTRDDSSGGNDSGARGNGPDSDTGSSGGSGGENFLEQFALTDKPIVLPEVSTPVVERSAQPSDTPAFSSETTSSSSSSSSGVTTPVRDSTPEVRSAPVSDYVHKDDPIVLKKTGSGFANNPFFNNGDLSSGSFNNGGGNGYYPGTGFVSGPEPSPAKEQAMENLKTALSRGKGGDEGDGVANSGGGGAGGGGSGGKGSGRGPASKKGPGALQSVTVSPNELPIDPKTGAIDFKKLNDMVAKKSLDGKAPDQIVVEVDTANGTQKIPFEVEKDANGKIVGLKPDTVALASINMGELKKTNPALAAYIEKFLGKIKSNTVPASDLMSLTPEQLATKYKLKTNESFYVAAKGQDKKDIIFPMKLLQNSQDKKQYILPVIREKNPDEDFNRIEMIADEALRERLYEGINQAFEKVGSGDVLQASL